MSQATAHPADAAPAAPLPLGKPLLVYDGDCSFCKFWVNRWQRRTGDRVDYVPYQHLPDSFQGVHHAQFRRSVYLFTRQAVPLHGAAAAVRLLRMGGIGIWHWLYYRVPLAGRIFELGYRMVANNRDFFYKLTKLFFR